jgi:hypothetical protein
MFTELHNIQVYYKKKTITVMLIDLDLPITRITDSSPKRGNAVWLSLLVSSRVRRDIAIRNASEMLLFQNYWIGRGYRE